MIKDMVEQLTKTTPGLRLQTLGDTLKKAARTTRLVTQNAMVIAQWTAHEIQNARPRQAGASSRKRRLLRPTE